MAVLTCTTIYALSRSKRNNIYSCKPQFYYIKVGFNGVKIIQVCFRDGSQRHHPNFASEHYKVQISFNSYYPKYLDTLRGMDYNFRGGNSVKMVSSPFWKAVYLNLSPAEPGYTLPLQTVQIQISWLLKKPTDLELHCLSLSMWICINNLDPIGWQLEVGAAS